MNPTPNLSLADARFLEERREIVVDSDALREYVHGRGALSGDPATRINGGIARLRQDVERVCDDLRRRIGSLRSRSTLVSAYALRCAWYDATGVERLIASIDD